MTITVDIPALNRLCAILENQGIAQLIPSTTPMPEGFTEVPTPADLPWGNATQAEAPAAPAAPAEPAPAPAPEPKPPAITLDMVQRACAGLRDQGKLQDVKALFPEFGIKKLSDLKSNDQLAAFADRLKELGAKL